MRILAIHVGRPRRHGVGDGELVTAIFKQTVEGPVRVGLLNVEGDEQADPTVHGGRNKAVYAYPAAHYGAWADELGRELEPSQFGENLTVDGANERDVLVGQRLRAGTVLFEVSQPRVPCVKLGLRVGDPTFPKRFLASGRSGFYLRVEEEGVLAAGDELVPEGRPAHGISVHDVWRVARGGDDDVALARRVLELPHLGPEWRRPLEALVERG